MHHNSISTRYLPVNNNVNMQHEDCIEYPECGTELKAQKHRARETKVKQEDVGMMDL
jgi:hypothetical protein